MNPALTEAARAFAAGLPEACEDHPWGESVYEVGKKVSSSSGFEADTGLRFTVKLRDSHEEAMAFEWVLPAGYGLDRGGWGDVRRARRCAAGDDHPLDRGELPHRRAEGAGGRAPHRLSLRRARGVRMCTG